MNFIEMISKTENEEIKIQEDKFRNPYRILGKHRGKNTAYIFTVPIYSLDERKLVDLKWGVDGRKKVFSGADAEISFYGKRAVLENSIDRAVIKTEEKYQVFPGLNGINLSSENGDIVFTLETEYPYIRRENTRSFTLMYAKHVPFITVTPAPAEKFEGIFVKAFVEATEIKERRFKVRIFAKEKVKKLTAEINLYLPKLIFDTTVESAFPSVNNVYGSYSSLGESNGNEERLLFRTGFFSGAFGGIGKPEKAEIFIPKFGSDTSEIGVYKILQPWCTFNTCWDNMPKTSEKFQLLMDAGEFFKTDITESFTDLENYGYMLKSIKKEKNIAISTADSYCHPQIIKIQYKD